MNAKTQRRVIHMAISKHMTNVLVSWWSDGSVSAIDITPTAMGKHQQRVVRISQDTAWSAADFYGLVVVPLPRKDTTL